jgi:hypothetical protein
VYLGQLSDYYWIIGTLRWADENALFKISLLCEAGERDKMLVIIQATLYL